MPSEVSSSDMEELRRQISAQREALSKLTSLERQVREEGRTLTDTMPPVSSEGDTRSPPGRASTQPSREQEVVRIDLTRGQDDLNSVLEQIHSIPPRQLIESCDDSSPFLLIPVRLECRFKTVQRRKELWIRIYPDDISVDSFDENLSKEEVLAAERFWTELWRAGGDEVREVGAWRVFAESQGANRAVWIARSHAPTNELNEGGTSNRPQEPLDEDAPLAVEPTFPLVVGQSDDWSRPAVAIGMPDRFVAHGYVDGKLKFEAVGNPIPEHLVVGPDPSLPDEDEDEADDEDDDDEVFDPAMKWMIDFDEAVRVGMGLKVLLPPKAQSGVDELVVLGLRLSADQDEAKRTVEKIIETHRYSESGFSFVPQGTATNNVGDDVRQDAHNPSDVAEVFKREFKTEPPTVTGDWRTKTDGQHFAHALSIDEASVNRVAHSDGKDQTDAKAMNIALWPATMGLFLEDMMDPLFDAATLRSAREFFETNVSGRGPVPTFRIGDQPYGVLVSSALSMWQTDVGKVSSTDRGRFEGHWQQEKRFSSELYKWLQRLVPIWDDYLKQVSFIGKEGDGQAHLLNVLGLRPRSAEYHQRFALGVEHLTNMYKLAGHANLAAEFWQLLAASSTSIRDSLGIPFGVYPEIAKKVFFDTTGFLSGPFVDDKPVSEIDALRSISEDDENYLKWLATSDVDTLRRNDFGAKDGGQIASPRALLFLLMRHGVMESYWDAAWQFHNTAGLSDGLARQDPPMANIAQGDTAETKLQLLYRNASTLASHHPSVFNGNGTIGVQLSQASIVAARPEAANLRKVRQAIEALADRPTAALSRTLSEHIDLCSYRLDAWQLGLVNERLSQFRNMKGEQQSGNYIGCFGYLEDLRPSPESQPVRDAVPVELQDPGSAKLQVSPNNGGYIPAPSLNHGVTATILRSAFLTHSDPDDAETMSVNLSSDRVRTALKLIEAVRNGQGLAEMLGYMFERGLHDRHGQAEVDKFILPMRQAFPQTFTKLPSSNQGQAQETVAPRSIMDGNKLIEHIRSTGNKTYPFGISSLPNASLSERGVIDTEVDRLFDAVDSIGDLQISEAVYGATLGNLDRTSAALDTMSGTSVIAEPDIAKTPGMGRGVTHRLCLLFDGTVPHGGANPYTGEISLSPRAALEPAFNMWLATLIGNPADIVCSVNWQQPDGGSESGFTVTSRDISLVDLSLQPIDLLYIAEPNAKSQAGEMDARISFAARQLEGLAADIELTIEYATLVAGKTTLFQILSLIRSLKGLCLGCKTLGGLDFAIPSGEADVEQPTAPAATSDQWDVVQLESRLNQSFVALETLNGSLVGFASDVNLVANDPIKMAELRGALLAAANFGIMSAVPNSSFEIDLDAAQVLVAQAERASSDLEKRKLEYSSYFPIPSDETDESKVEKLIAAGKALMGKDFVLIPSFSFNNSSEINSSASAKESLLGHVKQTDPFPLETWLSGLARVRDKPRQLASVAALSQMRQSPELELTPLQLPHRADDHWLGMELPDDFEFESDTLLATTVFASSMDRTAPVAGLLLDEWVEVIPPKLRTGAVAFHYDAPGAEAPQTLLLAVSPTITGHWKWDNLVETIRETIDMAKRRAVEPQQIDDSVYAQYLPGIMMPVAPILFTFSMNFALNASVVVANLGGDESQ